MMFDLCCSRFIFSQHEKHICIFLTFLNIDIVAQCKTSARLSHTINTVIPDDLTMQEVKASATMVLSSL